MVFKVEICKSLICWNLKTSLVLQKILSINYRPGLSLEQRKKALSLSLRAHSGGNKQTIKLQYSVVSATAGVPTLWKGVEPLNKGSKLSREVQRSPPRERASWSDQIQGRQGDRSFPAGKRLQRGSRVWEKGEKTWSIRGTQIVHCDWHSGRLEMKQT